MKEVPYVLKPVQKQALLLICAGATLTAAAKELGVHRNTLGNWMNLGIFRKGLQRACYDQEIQWRDAATEHVLAAIAVIAAIMHNESNSPSVRLKAAKMILDRGTGLLAEPPNYLDLLHPYDHDISPEDESHINHAVEHIKLEQEQCRQKHQRYEQVQVDATPAKPQPAPSRPANLPNAAQSPDAPAFDPSAPTSSIRPNFHPGAPPDFSYLSSIRPKRTTSHNFDFTKKSPKPPAFDDPDPADTLLYGVNLRNWMS